MKIKMVMVFLISLCVFLIACYKLHTTIMQSFTYQVYLDPLFSDHYSKELENVLATYWDIYKNKPTNLHHLIQQTSAAIGTFSIRYTPHQCAIITINAAQPLGIINDAYIITQEKKLVPLSYYRPELRHDLSPITIPHEDVSTEALSDDFFNFLTTRVPYLSVTHNIIWHNKTFIQLIDKEEKNSIIFHAQQKITHDIIRVCKEIIQPYNEKDISWCADIRFKDMIVIGQGDKK